MKRERRHEDRLEFLQRLMTEFEHTSDVGIQEQILANLANFAFDPANYNHFMRLNMIDLFLDVISIDKPNTKHQEFAIAAICNCCLDPQISEFLIANDGISLVAACMSSSNVETVMSAITTLYYLLNPKTFAVISSPQIVSCIREFCTARNVRLNNLAKILSRKLQLS